MTDDAILDVIYSTVDNLMVAGEFRVINTVLVAVDVGQLDCLMMVGLLIAVLPAKSKLECHGQFVSDVREELKRRGEYNPAILSGLE